MSLVFSCSPASLLLMMADTTDTAAAAAPGEFDSLELRNRTVTETLAPLEDLGQESKVREDLRRIIVTVSTNRLRRTVWPMEPARRRSTTSSS